MWRLLKIIGVVLLLIVAVVYGAKWYYKSKPDRDVTKEQAIEVTAHDIYNDFISDEAAANQKYLNKAVQVTGEVAEVKTNQDGKTVVFLKTADPVFGVNCTFKEEPGEIRPGSIITFKGICTGFLSDVVINEGVLIKKQS